MKSKIFKISKIVAASLAGLLLLLSLSAVVYCGAIGVDSFDEGVAAIKALFIKENNIHYRKSYTVSAKKAQAKRETVVATLEGAELTNGELQVSYWMNVYDYLNNFGYYAAYAGLDHTKPLDEQTCNMVDGTWQQFFLEDALDNWHTYRSMALLAQAEGLGLVENLQENLDSLRDTMTQTALKNGFESLDAMIQKDMGPGCTFDDYYSYMLTYYQGYMYYTDRTSKLEITEEMIEAYFAQHESELAESKITKKSGDLVDIRHILIQPEGGVADENDDMTYTDAAWEACKAEAQTVLEQYLKDPTEANLEALAEKYSDSGTAESDGGLVENVYKGYLTDELDEWCFKEGRKAGDCELVKTKYGYHVVYFVAAEAEWHRECRNGVIAELANEVMDQAKARYPMEVDYKKIVLGEVDLSGE